MTLMHHLEHHPLSFPRSCRCSIPKRPSRALLSPNAKPTCLVTHMFVFWGQGFDEESGEPKQPVEIESWPHHKLLLQEVRAIITLLNEWWCPQTLKQTQVHWQQSLIASCCLRAQSPSSREYANVVAGVCATCNAADVCFGATCPFLPCMCAGLHPTPHAAAGGGGAAALPACCVRRAQPVAPEEAAACTRAQPARLQGGPDHLRGAAGGFVEIKTSLRAWNRQG